MSDSDECSQSKRQKVIISDNDVKNELLLTDSSDEKFFSDEDDVSRSSLSDSSIQNEPVSLENKDLSAGSSQQDKWGRFQPSTSSTPATEDESIPFNEKQHSFFENLGSSPMAFFNFFFDDELLLFICEQTNAQAAKLVQTSKANSILRLWKDITICELKVFLGLLFHMGTIPLQCLRDYWKTSRLFSIPIFRHQMSQNRFMVIMKCLNFTSETDNSEDPLFKTRVLIDYFNHKMDTCYYPGKELCLDDSMVFWKARLLFSQHVKNTSMNYVNKTKLYMLTEPDGLIVKFLAFPGRREDLFIVQDHTEHVVMQLMENKLHKGHSMYMDICYNSVGLARKLLENKTYCTGMLRKDLQDNPVQITQENLNILCENVSLIKDGVGVHKFHTSNKHAELYISTEFPSQCISVTNSRGKTSMKPLAISKYHEIMLGVDRQQHLMEYYPCAHKCLRWYMKIANHIFHMLFLNAHKLYNKYSGNKMSFYDYRLTIINQLLPVNPSIPVSNGSHGITRITDKNSKGMEKRKQCRHCWRYGRRKKTSFNCLACPGQPAMCIECFDAYHTSSGAAVAT